MDICEANSGSLRAIAQVHLEAEAKSEMRSQVRSKQQDTTGAQESQRFAHWERERGRAEEEIEEP